MSELTKFAMIAFLAALAGGVATAANASVIYDATGGAENGGDPTLYVGPVIADRFVTTAAGSLASVAINLENSPGALAGTGFTVDLFADLGADGPGAATFIAAVSDTSLSSAFTLTTFTPAAPIALAADSSYYIGILDPTLTSSVTVGNTLDPAVLGRASVITGSSYFNSGGVQSNVYGPYEILVSDTPVSDTPVPVPEPAGSIALLGGAAMLALAKRRRVAV